jgi:hypothetical protein
MFYVLFHHDLVNIKLEKLKNLNKSLNFGYNFTSLGDVSQ